MNTHGAGRLIMLMEVFLEIGGSRKKLGVDKDKFLQLGMDGILVIFQCIIAPEWK